MADNTDCGHSEWPLGTSTVPSCSMAKSVWESLFPSTLHAEVLAVHPLKYLCGFTHMVPGAPMSRGVVPPSLPRCHPLLLMCQQRARVPARWLSLLPGIYGPSQMKSGSLERARTANMNLSKKRPTWDGPKYKGLCCPMGKCSLMSLHLSVSPGSDRSTSPLRSTQPSTANWMLLNKRGNFRYSQHGFGGASSVPVLPTTSLCSFWKEKNPLGWESIRQSLRCNFSVKLCFTSTPIHRKKESYWHGHGLKGTSRLSQPWSHSLC